MELHFTECEAGNQGLISDLAKYKKVDEYLRAIVNDDPNVSFQALDCAFCGADGQWRHIVCAGHVTDDAKKNINWLKRQPAHMRNIVSDRIVIKADAFERELYFSWR